MKISDLESWREGLINTKNSGKSGGLINEICYFGLHKFPVLVRNLKKSRLRRVFPLYRRFLKLLSLRGKIEGKNSENRLHFKTINSTLLKVL